MTQRQQKQLEIILRVNPLMKIVWNPDRETCRIIISISENNRNDEPSLCAFFENGEYVALYNVEATEFFMIQPIFSEQ